jgi:Xaa-Pro dipeptidase
MTGSYFPKDEYETRWERVHQEMRRRNLEATVVWGRTAGTFCRAANIHYLANYHATLSGQGADTHLYNARGHCAVVLQLGETPELHADQPSPRLDLIPTDRVAWHWDPIKGVAEALKKRGIAGRVGLVGSDMLPMKYWQQLKSYTPEIEWEPHDDLVLRARLVKSQRELDTYRVAGEIVTRSLNRLIEGLVLGKTEAEAAGDAAREVVRGGGVVHKIACSHGDTIDFFCRDPLTGYSHDAAKRGDLVRGWVYGPIFQGYYLDPGRTAVCGGKPSTPQRELIEACAGIVEKVMAEVRPGRLFREPADVGDRLVGAFGGEKDQAAMQWPHYGHSVGLFFEAPPYISNVLGNDADRFEPGMVIGVEAFLSRPGVGAAGFEQMFIVGEDENEILSPTPLLWW